MGINLDRSHGGTSYKSADRLMTRDDGIAAAKSVVARPGPRQTGGSDD